MGILNACPLGASLPDVVPSDCPFNINQIVKLGIQRIYTTPGVKNVVATPGTKASWTAMLSAKDGKKLVISPFIEAVETTPGEAIEFGSGNDVVGGIPINVGTQPTSLTAVIRQQSQDVIASMKKMMGENIGVYFIDLDGNMAMWADNPKTPTSYGPMPIRSFFIGDYTFGGLEGLGSNSISFKLLPNWSDHLVKVVPTDFNAMTDLVTPSTPAS